ncbi:MAG: signal recognition particle-docking protein FtsY [Clostridia bacterium]|nr:signal recognition particle-docking protein FtsY [Clostridia bacterium]
MGVFKKINFGLKKTRDNMSGAIDNVLNAFEEIGDELYDELTEVLVMGDVGVYTAEKIIEELKDRVGKKPVKNTQEVREVIKDIVTEMLSGDEEIDFVTVPAVILVIGVNGVGKTTTIGKMAAYFKAQGKSVILGAADTFRAAAIDQLEIWAQRAGVDMVKHKEGADPAAVVFDTINAGIARDADIIICDTAGRLHNKKNLMDELAKIYKVIDRELPYSDRESFLVLDATTGQNAVNQAKEFKAVADITGIILTKLDGTARGGVVLSIKNDLKVPVKFIGVGEGIDDLQPFNAKAFAEGLFDVVPENFEEEELEIEDNDLTGEPEEEESKEEKIEEKNPEENSEVQEAEGIVKSEDEQEKELKDKKKKKGFLGWFKGDKEEEKSDESEEESQEDEE